MQQSHKKLVFLGMNAEEVRFAEILFNSEASKIDLGWQAIAKEDPEQGVAASEFQTSITRLKARGVCDLDLMMLPRTPPIPEDLEQAEMIVCLEEQNHWQALLQKTKQPSNKIQVWSGQAKNAADRLASLEQSVLSLVVRLVLERGQQAVASTSNTCPTCRRHLMVCACPKKTESKTPRASNVVRVCKETKGRKGKVVTCVADIPLDDAGLAKLATQLKQRCGSGGTVKDGRIEIQGDHREELARELESIGYRVKKV